MLVSMLQKETKSKAIKTWFCHILGHHDSMNLSTDVYIYTDVVSNMLMKSMHAV